MNVRIRRISRGFLAAIAVAGFSLLAIPSTRATTYYWDGNDSTLGFGTAGGTWADPTLGTLTSGWSLSNNGTAAVNGNSVTTTTSDTLNFGQSGVGLGLATGTITVSGTVNAGTITGVNPSASTTTLSGGTINFASSGTITTGSNTAIFIDSQITGASTGLSKTGSTGSIRLTNANNSYAGVTSIIGTLQASHLFNGGLNSSIGASSNATTNLVLSTSGTLSYIGAGGSTDRLFTLSANATVASDGTGAIQFNNPGAIAYGTANATRTLTLGGAYAGGNNTFSPLLANNGTGATSFTKSGNSTWVLTNNSNSYTGQTNISGGTLVIGTIADYGTNSAIGQGTAGTGIIIANGNVAGTLIYTGGAQSSNRTVQISSTANAAAGIATILNNGTGTLTFTSATFNPTYTNGNNLTRTLALGGTNDGVIQGIIQDSSPTVRNGISKIDSGTWTLQGINTYSGSTDINGGTLRFQSGASDLTQSRAALRAQLGDGTFDSNKAGAGNITTSFTSFARVAGATGNIVSTGGTNGTNNSVNITGAAGFINVGLFFGGSEYASRNGTDGFVRALAYGSDPSTAAVNTVTASNHVKLTTTSYSGAGVTLLSLNLAGSGINWTNTSGNLTTPGIIKSGGGSQSTISGGNLTGGSNTEVVVRTNASDDLLTISSNLTQGSGALTKAGAGTLTLSGTNTYTGQTHVNAGTLSIGANVNLGAEATGAALNLKGGTLQATGTFGLFNGTAGTNNRAVTLLNQSTIDVAGANTLTIAGAISSNANAGATTPGFNKTGTGTLVVSGANTYTGATNVNAGTLLLNGSHSTGGLYTLASGATLGGNGTMTSAVDVFGKIAPGNSIDTLDTGTVTWNGAASAAAATDWVFELDGVGNTADLLNISGDFLKDTGVGSVFRFDFANSAVDPGDTFDLVTWSGSNDFSELDFSFTNLGGGNSGDFQISGKTLQFVVVPEPASLALLASGVAIFGYRFARRRGR